MKLERCLNKNYVDSISSNTKSNDSNNTMTHENANM
jgi:hypothetical protein